MTLSMIKNIIKVLFSNVILTIVGLINSFIFPNILSIEEYAFYQEYLLLISYMNICHLGIPSGMFLNYAGHKYCSIPKEQYKSEILLLFFVLSEFSILGILVAIFTNFSMIWYVVLTIFPLGIVMSFQALYQAWERFTEYSLINAFPKVLFTVSVIIFYLHAGNIDGKYVVITYLLMQWGTAIFFMVEFLLFTKNVSSNKIFSDKNKNITTNGFLITLGNYINLLFHSIDRQFVNALYSTFSFAQYSFAMSTQTIMTVFITALANPFYPKLVQDEVDQNFLIKIKELLLLFGAYSGCAYFCVSFVVQHFIPKYHDALVVVAIFFAVFPAMAVINVLYINLYKSRRKIKQYICSLLVILVVSILLNTMSVLFQLDYIGIAFATLLSYYIWLIFSQKDFEEICICKKDIIYLFGFFFFYFLLIQISHSVIGLILYAIIITFWNYTIYKDTTLFLLKKVEKIKFLKLS